MKATGKEARRAYAGLALPSVITVVMVLLAIGTGLLGLSLHSRVYSVRTNEQLSARCAADAGAAEALATMNATLEADLLSSTDPPAVSGQSLANCDATFSYKVTGDALNGFSLKSRGQCGRRHHSIHCSVSLKGPFEFALYTKEDLKLKASSVVDWYNYDKCDEWLKIGSESVDRDTIELFSGSTINGNVFVGVGGDPAMVVKDMGADITGQIYVSSEMDPLPKITVPGWLASLPSGGQIKTSTTISDSGKYEDIDLNNSEVIVIDGPVFLYVTGDIQLGNSAELQVADSATNPDACLVLYLGGKYEAKNSGSINNKAKKPSKLKIYGLDSCNTMRFKNGCEFYGAIYAPEADVIFDNSADAYGAVIANRFEQRNSAGFHYDASLRDVSEDDEAVRFVADRWSEQ